MCVDAVGIVTGLTVSGWLRTPLCLCVDKVAGRSRKLSSE